VYVGTNAYKEPIASFRRKAQRVPKKRLVFMDQTPMYLGSVAKRSMAPPGRPAIISSKSTTWYPPRVDFMGSVSYHRVLSCKTTTPTMRQWMKVRGWRKWMVLGYLKTRLARDLNGLGESGIILVIDKALRIKSEEAKQALIDGGCTCISEVWIIPTGAGKHVSPLDNHLWADLKKRVNDRDPKTPNLVSWAMKVEWKRVSPEHIHHYYSGSGLTYGTNPYKGLR
jgi:hypothetical protein